MGWWGQSARNWSSLLQNYGHMKLTVSSELRGVSEFEIQKNKGVAPHSLHSQSHKIAKTWENFAMKFSVVPAF